MYTSMNYLNKTYFSGETHFKMSFFNWSFYFSSFCFLFAAIKMPIFKLMTKDRTQRYTISANNVLQLKQKAVQKLLLPEEPELTIMSVWL